MNIFATTAYENAQERLKENQEAGLVPQTDDTPQEQPQVQAYTPPVEKEETPKSTLTDEDRREYLKMAQEEGVPISKFKAEKFGADPAAFLIEDTYSRAKEAGWTNVEYKKAVNDMLVKNGYDLKDFQQDDGNFINNRFETGLANSLMEMYVGGKEILGMDVSDTENTMNENLYSEKKQREAYHKYAEATMEENDDGTESMDSNFDIAGGLGEAAPSVVLGLGVGGGTARAGYGLTKALATDFAAQQALSGMEYKGASDVDTGAGTQLAFETAGNVAGFGIGRLLGNIGTKVASKSGFEGAVNDMGQAKAADILQTIDFAKKNGVNILGHDVDPGTQYSQLMEAASSNPVLSGKLKEVTEQDVTTITDYLSKVKNDYDEVMTTDTNTGQYISRAIDAQEENFDTAIKQSYGDMDAMMANNPSAMTNETFTTWLGGIKDKVNTKDMSPKVRKHLQSSLDEYIADFQATGKNVNVASMYNIMRDTIAEASSLSKQVDKGSESKAYAQLAEIFEGQFDSMSDLAGKGNPKLAETIGKAKSLYKERVELFGYRGTGKGGKGTGFVSSFRDKYAKDPEGAMKLVNTPEKVREVKNIIGESGDTMGIMQRNFLDRATTDKNGTPLSMEEIGKNLSAPRNQDMIAELYGESAQEIRNLAKVMNIVGKREKALSKTSSLVGNAVLNDSNNLAALVKNAMKFAQGKYKGKGLVAGDRKILDGIEAEMQKKLGMSLDEYAQSMKGSQTMSPSVDVARTADDLYQSPDGVPTKAEGQAVQDDLTAQQDNLNTANKAERAQQTELQGRDKVLARQQGRLNKEVTTRFRSKQVGADDRLEYNRIQDDIETARNAGNTQKVEESISELSAFTEHTKNLPDRETSKESAKRVAKEKAEAAEAARIVAKQRAADLEARQARQAMEREANQRNRARLDRARAEQRAADAEASTLADAERQAEHDRIASRNRVITTRDQANNNMVDTLNEKLSEGWQVSTSDGNHPRFTNRSTGSYFTLHQYTESMGATTVGLHNGAGEGSKVYHAIFDMAEELGVYYKPDSTLLTANPVRTGMNMITYMKGRTEDANHIMISPSQKAIGTRGSEDYLGNKKLTKENANQLAMNMKGLANRKLPSGINLSARTTDKKIDQMAQTTGGDPNMRLGPASLKLLRDFLASGRDLSAMGGILGLMMMDDELMSFLDDSEEGI